MEIQKINFYLVKTPYPHKGGRLWTFVKLTTDEGIEGWGEAYHLPISESSIKVLKEMGNKYVMGTNPFEIERLFLRFFSSEYAQHPDFIAMGATSA